MFKISFYGKIRNFIDKPSFTKELFNTILNECFQIKYNFNNQKIFKNYRINEKSICTSFDYIEKDNK